MPQVPLMTPEERLAQLAMMRSAAARFYAEAVHIGVHPFVEFAGFLNEYIKACSRMHDEGKDFTMNDVELMPYELAYLAEKVDCIFGQALSVPENRAAFLRGLAP